MLTKKDRFNIDELNNMESDNVDDFMRMIIPFRDRISQEGYYIYF